MYTSLRARLWLTYAIIILLILSILGIGNFVYIIRHPLIDRQALGRLDAALTVIRVRSMNARSFPGIISNISIASVIPWLFV